MKKILFILAILPLLAISCQKEPYAEALITPNPASVGETIRFLSLSQNTAYVEWDLGNGTKSSADVLDYAYSESGTYTVTLKAFGERNDVSVARHIVEVEGVMADASITPNPAWVGEDISFIDLSSNSIRVEWDLGDGGTSVANDVSYYYIDPGSYNVSLKAYGSSNDVSIASFVVDVEGSELNVIVKDVLDDYIIEGASVLLYASWDDWLEAEPAKAVGGEQFTNSQGECWFEGLSYQQYYVDVYYRVGDEGYVNWLLGEENIEWVETQELPGGWDHTFIAYVDAVTFDDARKSAGRPAVRPPLKDLSRGIEKASVTRALKENKTSTKLERK